MKKHFELRKIGSAALPYIYFIGLAAFWLFSELLARQSFSYIALGVIIVLIIQAIRQHKVAGVCLGTIAVAVNSYFFLAVLSEFGEFEAISGSALQLIAVGSMLSLSGLTMGVIMATTNLEEVGSVRNH